MKFGVYIFPPGAGAATDILPLASAAERLRFDSVWMGDHVAWPERFETEAHHRDVGGRTPPQAAVHSNVYEPLTTLAFVAGAVPRIRIGLGVLIVPYRNPILTAKMLSTIDVLSNGRLIVGVGAGWMKEEFTMLDAPPYEERGSVTDDYVQSFIALWTEAKPRHDGAHVRIADLLFNPKPVQKPYPPIWVGGNGPAAMKRAASYGDGWMPLHQTPADMAGKVRSLREAVQRNGRDPKTVGVAVGCRFRFADAGATEPDTLIGTSGTMIEQLRRYQEAGVEEVHLLNDGYGNVADAVGAWERFAEDVATKV